MAYSADAETSSSLKELKEVIFDLDWEISDQSLDRLSSVLSPLKEKWKNRKPYLVCFKIIENIGLYVKKAKHRSHPEAINLLTSVFETLDKINTDGNLTEEDRLNLVRAELDRYNGLKGELIGQATDRKAPEQSAAQPGPATAEAPPPPQPAPTPPQPQVQPQQDAEEKEIVLTKVDDQSFPEAEKLLDDFFADDTESESPSRETAIEASGAKEDEVVEDGDILGTDAVDETVTPAVETESEAFKIEAGLETEAEAEEVKLFEEAVEENDAVEFDLGADDNDKKIVSILDATKAELQARVGEKLGLREEKDVDERDERDSGDGGLAGEESNLKLDAIIDEFSREVISVIAKEVRKTIREEITKGKPGGA